MMWQHSDGDPPNGGLECRGGYEKVADFRPISRYILETVKMGLHTLFQWNTNSDLYTP